MLLPLGRRRYLDEVLDVTALTHSHYIFTVLSHHLLLKEQDAAKLVASLEKGKSKAVVVTWMTKKHRLMIRGPKEIR